MTQKLTNYKWYNFDRILAYAAVWMFIVGSRGEGKTYGAIKRCIKLCIRNGQQFIYLRRHDKELNASIASFFQAFEVRNEFPDWDFRIHTDIGVKYGQMSPKKDAENPKRKWTTVCIFISLSRVQSYKSVNYAKVRTIIFDEFIMEKGYGMYIPGEYEAMMNFYITVDRWRDVVQVFFLANSVSIMNPYFTELNINPDLVPEFSRYNDGFAVLHVSNNQEFKKQVGETRLAKFLHGTGFGEFAIGNSFRDAHQELIRKKTPDAKYRYTLETAKGTFAVWRDFETDIYFLQTKRPGAKGETVYTLISDNMTDEKMLVTVQNDLLGGLRTAFRHGRAYFDRASTRIAFAEVFKR